MELMRQADQEGLVVLAREDRRAVSALLGRLWDSDAAHRELAAHALGSAATAHPNLLVEIVRRLMWALNDESATNGRYAVPALGEIGYHNPELIAPFVGPMSSYLWDPDLRSELLDALHRIADADPELLTGLAEIEPETWNDCSAEHRERAIELGRRRVGGINGP